MMTQLQRDAIARAQGGDWSLADAMELLAEGRKWSNGHMLRGGVRSGGRLRLFIYGVHDDCADCNGNGALECLECAGVGDFECDACDDDGKVACPLCEQACAAGEPPDCATCGNTRKLDCTDCNGTGRCDCEACDDGRNECADCNGSGEGEQIPKRITDMNGRVVYDDATDETGDGPAHYVDFTREQAEKILHDYHYPPKPKAALPRPGRQTTLIPGDLAA